MLWSNDRNFNKEDFKDQLYYLVAEHNDLITKAKHDLTNRELKIMDYIVSKIKPDDEELNVIKTSMYELSKVSMLKRSGKAYSQLEDSLNKMRKKYVFIYNADEKRLTMTGWFEVVDVWENGQCFLDDTVQLKSKYSIILYKFLRAADKAHGSSIAVVQGTPEELNKWLGAPKSYSYGRLKDKIL